MSSDWALRVEYQYFDDFDDNFYQDLKSDLLSVGVSYSFGTDTATAAAAASAAAVTQAPSEPITEPETVAVEEEVEVMVTKAQTESFSQVTFAINSAELSDEGKAAVQPIVEVLQTYPQSAVNIFGHTDSTGAAEYNMMISKKRAVAVAAYIEEQGIDSRRITASG